MQKYYQIWKRRSTFEKIVIVLAAWYLWNFISKYLRGVKMKAEMAAGGIVNQQVATSTGIPLARVEQLNGMAVSLQIALKNWHKNWFGNWASDWTENEQEVVDLVNDCRSTAEVRYLCQAFMNAYPTDLPQQYRLTLRASIIEYCSDGWKEIKPTYWAVVN